MRRLQIKFPSQIRISGWDFGSSARAMNQAGGKDSLMTYLRVIFIQAESGKCPGSTFERKTMSSTIKRVALVAVASLGFGLLSTVSSQAAVGALTVSNDSVGTSSGTTATGIAGANNFVTLSYASGDAVALVVTGGVATTAASGAIGSGTANVTLAASGSAQTVFVPTPTVGTIYVKSYGWTNGVLNSTASATVTITVNAAAAGTVYNHSSVYINTTTNADATADSTTLSAVDTASNTARAIITVRQYSSVDTATAMTDAASAAVTVSVSGAGSVGLASATRGPSASVAAGTASSHGASESTTGTQAFFLFSDGRSGTSTVTVTVNGVVASTKTFTFTGTTVAKYAADTTTVFKKIIAVGGTSTQLINGLDSNGNKVAAGAGTIYAVSSDTAIATVSVSSQTLTVTGVKSGTANITVCDTALCASATKTLVIAVKVAKSTAATVVATFDQSSYAPGDAMTITLTAKDSDGNLVADGNYALVSGTNKYSKSFQSSSAVDALSGTIAVAGGVATATAYAPASEGAFAVTYHDALADADVTITTTVTGSNSDALDAANEATDAANAATDAANAAAEAADAATAAAQDAQAAVAALATQVASLIAGIKAQITTLTNLVIKIQKKVKA